MDRLPRRPDAPLRAGPAGRARRRAGRERDDRADARRVAQRRAEAPRKCDERVRPELPLRRPGRVRAQRAGARDGSADDNLGHAEVGQRRQGPRVPADEDGRLPELHARARDPLQRAAPRLPVRPLLRDLERVEFGQLPGAAVQLGRARSSARPRTRSSPPPATPESRRAARAHRSRSARPPRTARTSRRRARPTRPRRVRSQSWSRRRTRSSSSTPGRSTRIPSRSTRARRRRSATRTSPSAR